MAAIVSNPPVWPIPKQEENKAIFDMGSLRANLPSHPQKGGLSRHYSGKSRSFTCMADVHCVDDLKKPEIPGAKKRKKHAEMQGLLVPPRPCRRVSSSNYCSTPYVGV